MSEHRAKFMKSSLTFIDIITILTIETATERGATLFKIVFFLGVFSFDSWTTRFLALFQASAESGASQRTVGLLIGSGLVQGTF